eukprot:g46191.t1
MDEKAVEVIGRILVDVSRPLKERFRALFTLRNLGGPLAVEWISKGFGDESVLLKHELAYCLGQMQDQRAIPILIRVLQDHSQEPMVRHEAALEKDIKKLRETLLDESLPLFDRYRAMFALRNIGSQEAVLALGDGTSTVLLKREFQDFESMTLKEEQYSSQDRMGSLKKMDENPMVRHECAEALGSIAKEPCLEVLKEYLHDGERVVKESCEVALDMLEYENSPEF